ncbi:23192_t:CDS:2, partial [Gigaspora margarita]
QLDFKSSKSILEMESERWGEYIIRNNLNLQVLKVAKQYQIGFKSEEIEKELDLMGGKEELYNMIEKKNRKGFCKEQSLNLFFREQLVNSEGNSLLTWGQICQLRGKKGTERKPAWFEELELKMLQDVTNRNISEEFRTEGTNQFVIIPVLQKYSLDKRKREWIMFAKKRGQLQVGVSSRSKTVLEKCAGCEIGRKQEEASCVIAARFKNRKRALPKRLVQKENDQVTCSLNMTLGAVEECAKIELDSVDRQVKVKEVLVNAKEKSLIEEWIVEKEQIEKLKNIWYKMKGNKK